MVLHKHGERLYNGLKQVVTEHLEEKVIELSVLEKDFDCCCKEESHYLSHNKYFTSITTHNMVLCHP